MLFLTFSSIVAALSVLFLLVFISVKFYCDRLYKYWKKRGVPYVKPKFIYGNFEYAKKPKLRMGNILQDWYVHFKSKGCVHVGAFQYCRPIYIPIDINFIKNILQNDFKHFMARYAYSNVKDDPISGHILNLHGEKWRTVRQKISPMSSAAKVKSMFEIFLNCTKTLENCLDEEIFQGKSIEVRNISCLFTADIICSYAFGIEINSFKNPDNAIHKFGEAFFYKNESFELSRFLIRFFPELSKILRIKLTNEKTEKFFMKFFKDLVEYREKNNITRNDILQMMIQLKNADTNDSSHDEKFTMNDITAQLFSIFLAGYETSSGAMSHCLYELAKNQDIQDKVRIEIIDVLRKNDNKLTYEAINEMKYLEMTILEALRKYPPVDYLARRVTEDYNIPGTNITLEKGIGVYIPILAVHHDPEFYPNPDKFDPGRFSDENLNTRPDFAFLSFSKGPRLCTGMKMGIIQTKLGIIKLLMNYKFKPSSKTREPLAFKTGPVPRIIDGGIWLNAERIK